MAGTGAGPRVFACDRWRCLALYGTRLHRRQHLPVLWIRCGIDRSFRNAAPRSLCLPTLDDQLRVRFVAVKGRRQHLRVVGSILTAFASCLRGQGSSEADNLLLWGGRGLISQSNWASLECGVLAGLTDNDDKLRRCALHFRPARIPRCSTLISVLR